MDFTSWRVSRSSRASRRRPARRLVAATAALVGVVSAAACGSGGGGVPVINLYYAPEQNFQEFASAEWILEWTGDHQQQAEDGTLEVPLESARYEDRLYAAPKNTTR